MCGERGEDGVGGCLEGGEVVLEELERLMDFGKTRKGPGK